MAPTFALVKDPSAILDYTFDWTLWLAAGETIAGTGTTVTGPAGITVSAATVATPKVTVRISGGTAGTSYDVVCHIKTSATQEDERTLRLEVQDR